MTGIKDLSIIWLGTDTLQHLEHSLVTFRFVVPLFIRSQHHRHRTWSYNEISRRYTDVDIKFYSPTRNTGSKASPIDKPPLEETFIPHKYIPSIDCRMNLVNAVQAPSQGIYFIVQQSSGKLESVGNKPEEFCLKICIRSIMEQLT